MDRLEVQLRSELHSDPLPLRYFGQSKWAEHLTPRPGINLVQIDQSAEVLLASDKHERSVSLIARQFGRLVVSEETVRRLGEVARKDQSVQDWSLSPQMALKGFSGIGLDWQQSHPIASGWQWRWGAQGLLLRSLYARDLQGELNYQAANQTYAFDASSTEKNSSLKYPFQKSYDSSGQALLFQTHLRWVSGHMGLDAGIKDLGWLRWKQLPEQVLSLNSNVNDLDANGYLLYKPLLQGQNRQATVVWKAPWTAQINAHWSFTPDHQLSLPWQYIPNFGWLPAYRWTDTSQPLTWAVEWRQHDRNLVIQTQWQNWAVDFGLNNMASDSHSQVWRLSYSKKF